MVQRLPQLHTKVKQAVNKLKRIQYPSDYDQLYDWGLDKVIHQIRRLTAGRITEDQFDASLGFLHLQLFERATKVRRAEPVTEDAAEYVEHYETVEDVVVRYEDAAERRLTDDQELLLLRVVYKRDDEGLDDIFCPSQKHRWQKEVRPALKEWADGGDR